VNWARGIGELGEVGVATAITNAIYHATGKRIRMLPHTSQISWPERGPIDPNDGCLFS
jgi:CO/xanthine dehydrogenase Mo-binding subunit